MEKINIQENIKCNGCKNCYNLCPVKAISMIENSEGFQYPIIDAKKCINCGKCKLVCPVRSKVREDKLEQPYCYAVINKNEKILNKSTSGGAFYHLAKYIIDNEGVVYGASFDSKMKLKHIVINKTNEIEKLMGSKYLYSDLTNIFEDVKKNLTNNKLVLFTGVPCQIAALKKYLLKPYPNLVTMDVICHGTPNQRLFDKYIAYLEKKYKSKIINYEFRNKDKSSWGTFKAMAEFENGKKKYINADFDKYYISFLNAENYRESCYKCDFASLNRISDITVGDFWGIETINKEFSKKNGVSCVIVNTKKGKDLFKKINKDYIYLKVKYEDIYLNNGQLVSPSRRCKIRDSWYNKIDDEKFIENIHIRFNYKSYIKWFVPSKYKIMLKKILKGK